ncbi:hypothetical protein ABZ464_25040 [Streptomyces sp. NPDC005820]|uniref:hypothetical protein n=1 Tax=Streptomyces sp. NPDC005820 TaxID=3157069 RepID=UPI0033CEB3EC
MTTDGMSAALDPIYNRLVAERGDVLAQAREEADRVGRVLEQLYHPSGIAEVQDVEPGFFSRPAVRQGRPRR